VVFLHQGLGGPVCLGFLCHGDVSCTEVAVSERGSLSR
jgi:hypothetical protein